jgi:dethiobiotin synthetase/adenosylmethionine--8-amino-7-oxononanoate aminotransferase
MWAKAVFAVKFRNRIRASSLDALRHLWSGAAAKNAGAAAASAASSNGGGTTTDDRSVPLSVPAVCVWGANTGVGKTLVSAGVVREASLSGAQVAFVKPVQTGYPTDSDARLVVRDLFVCCLLNCAADCCWLLPALLARTTAFLTSKSSSCQYNRSAPLPLQPAPQTKALCTPRRCLRSASPPARTWRRRSSSAA